MSSASPAPLSSEPSDELLGPASPGSPVPAKRILDRWRQKVFSFIAWLSNTDQIRDANEVQHLFKSVRPCGSTPTGARLHSILKPYVSHISRRAENIDSTKPVNIIVITDGYPTDDPESIIVHHAKKLDQIEAPPHQIGIQFFQVGDKHGATKALRELDDDLKDQGIRDMVDTTTWNSTTPDNSHTLSGEGILKVVLGAVVRRIDRGTPRDNPQGHGQ
ncbi:hypothetical protein FPOA_13229 [Fusarium poae]|uniref:VWFA domain-containing protein n=1 Tax=Fusarium poae TaxID=36050 RepID=A0A1B8A6C7_FUSPO|nr:hypothetical protein FPOA_13229 [Fusarium poae]